MSEANSSPEFISIYESAVDDAKAAATLLLLHGTGGDERDLLEIGRTIAPNANLLGVRGKVIENGMNRFFRRLAPGVFDEADVAIRAGELAEFVREASQKYGFDPRRVYALGYSNGANIAAAVLMLHPCTLAGAILLRAMRPLLSRETATLDGTPILISGGKSDTMIDPRESGRLAELLSSCGAGVTLMMQEAGHNLVYEDIEQAKAWFWENS